MLTLTFIFVNILFFLIVYAFGHDNIVVGSGNPSGMYVNNTLDSSHISYTDMGVLESLKVGFSDLPFWANIFFGVFETSFIIILILSWVRGN